MTYFLDFDRTLFDTNSFTPYLRSRFSGSETAALESVLFAAEMERLVQQGLLSFKPGELAQFLFPEVIDFLRERSDVCTVITFGNPAFQKAKIESALNNSLSLPVMYTGDIRKGFHLAPHTHLHKGAIAVDDTPQELEILAAETPLLSLYEMRRDGGEGDGRWPVIHSLTELPLSAA